MCTVFQPPRLQIGCDEAGQSFDREELESVWRVVRLVYRIALHMIQLQCKRGLHWFTAAQPQTRRRPLTWQLDRSMYGRRPCFRVDHQLHRSRVTSSLRGPCTKGSGVRATPSVRYTPRANQVLRTPKIAINIGPPWEPIRTPNVVRTCSEHDAFQHVRRPKTRVFGEHATNMNNVGAFSESVKLSE
ncbi:uncharacterized protein C8Q71DRAFT_498679 [Rhodofomes roseus]|uniref:Uncharacterized protein n=1 Tax=Rhodofomes roseus TaxID=34475 RepID=A0ABQ8KLF7_9APHY|nr:uncharacterized protein C8Q71DRAFT_498679 [Rhodofomes roseus]KAH9839142.1 hypothetical protein C8Q71DRAFT_498679 [Rhodofomes roseus]